MEDIRTYRSEPEESVREDERVELGAATSEDEIPFHIPRD